MDEDKRYSGQTDEEGKKTALKYARQKAQETIGLVKAAPMVERTKDAILERLELAATTCTRGLFSDEKEARKDHKERQLHADKVGKSAYREALLNRRKA